MNFDFEFCPMLKFVLRIFHLLLPRTLKNYFLSVETIFEVCPRNPKNYFLYVKIIFEHFSRNPKKLFFVC